jgi:pyrophosphatase PpaX
MPAHCPTAVLFDLDGTLIDSIELILSSYRHTMLEHRGATPPDAVWVAGLGTPLWTQFRKFTDDESEVAAMVETYRGHNLANHDRMVRPYPGVLEAVRTLHEAGRDLAIVTSKTRDGAHRGLRHCGFDGLFPVVVGADDVERHKPDPAPVRHALELLGVAPGDAVFVGDSPHDLVAGRAAGVRTAAVAWGPFPREELDALRPDIWIQTAEDLAQFGRDAP